MDGGATSPQVFHGRVLVEVQGARPLEAPKNLHLTVPKSWSNIAQQYVDGYAFFHVHCSSKSQENPKGPKFSIFKFRIRKNVHVLHKCGWSSYVSKNDYNICKRKEFKIQNSSKVNVEDLWIEITNNFGDRYVVSVRYRHPRGNVDLFTEQLESSLSKIENDRTVKHNILTEGFNIDLIKFDINNNTNEYLNTVIKNGFIPTILLQTRVSSHTCTLIDHIFYLSRNSWIQVSSGNLMTDMSDHFANFLILHSSAKSKLADRPEVRILSNKNKKNFKRLIGKIKTMWFKLGKN